MKKSIIVAIAWNGVIGHDGDLPWRLPADLKYFKKTTMGHHLLMGRKTYQSIGKPLPGRKIIVLSTSGFDPDLPAETEPEAVTVAANLEDAFTLASDRGEEELMIAGGAKIYQQVMDRVDRLYVTRVDSSFEGDVSFAFIDPEIWSLADERYHLPDDRNEYPMRFQVWDREE